MDDVVLELVFCGLRTLIGDKVSKVLVILAHPKLSDSTVNKALIQEAASVNGVKVRDLYAKYPDFKIDVDREQALLTECETLVFQHPLYWYSCPALLKEWLDSVLLRNFAYGKHGKALTGKRLLSVVSAGGPQETYCSAGSNEHSVESFLKTFELTAKFCNMKYETPLVLHNTYRAKEADINHHVGRYGELLGIYAGMQ